MVNDDRDDKMTFEGIVLDSNKGIFRVQTDEGNIITTKLSGKLKMHEIKVIVNDRVSIECSPYDLTLGRIVKRYK
jgi:translation initiation factor IF-1